MIKKTLLKVILPVVLTFFSTLAVVCLVLFYTDYKYFKTFVDESLGSVRSFVSDTAKINAKHASDRDIAIDKKIAELNERSTQIEKAVGAIRIAPRGSIERNYMFVTSVLLKLERSANRNENLSSIMPILTTASYFDKNLYEMVKTINRIKSVKTLGQIANNFKPIVRDVASQYYKKKGYNVRSFFAKYIYVAKVGGRLERIDTFLSLGDLHAAEILLIEVSQDVESETLKRFIKDVQDYNNLYDTLNQMYNYIGDVFTLNFHS